jgi:hypothetical protein
VMFRIDLLFQGGFRLSGFNGVSGLIVNEV